MSQNVNWHLATTCALRIDLRDYESILEYDTEYTLGKNYYRIDLLIIRKISDLPISKALAADFKKVNLFEIKGIGSSVSIQSYYKMHGYAGLYLDTVWKDRRLTAKDLTINFISRSFPMKLFNHLREDCHFTVEKIAPGIYDVINAMYVTRFIVTKELSPKDYLYLRCLTNKLTPEENLYIKELDLDYYAHKTEPLYVNYVNEFLETQKGGSPMKKMVTVAENAFKLMGTTSEAVREQQRQEDEKYYSAKLQELSKEISRLQKLLAEHGIRA